MTQLTPEDLKGMTPEEVDAAYTDGRCAVMLGATSEDAELISRAREHLITTDDLRRLRDIGRDDLIAAAHETNRITSKEN